MDNINVWRPDSAVSLAADLRFRFRGVPPILADFQESRFQPLAVPLDGNSSG